MSAMGPGDLVETVPYPRVWLPEYACGLRCIVVSGPLYYVDCDNPLMNPFYNLSGLPPAILTRMRRERLCLPIRTTWTHLVLRKIDPPQLDHETESFEGVLEDLFLEVARQTA